MSNEKKWPTQFDRRGRRISNHGSRKVVKYSSHVDEYGNVELEAVGQDDLYDMIQSHADSVNINVLLKRFQMGDATALGVPHGSFGDFTEMPTTYAEMLNKINRAQEIFDSLPVEQRSKFDHDFNQFIATLGTEEWLDKMGYEPPADPASVADQTVAKEVVTE